jgi:hypothetical protein
MPKATADEQPEIHLEARPAMPTRAEVKKRKLATEHWIDAVR